MQGRFRGLEEGPRHRMIADERLADLNPSAPCADTARFATILVGGEGRADRASARQAPIADPAESPAEPARI